MYKISYSNIFLYFVGKKHFDTLSVKKASVLDTIDGVDPSTLILLSTDETLKNKFEFDNLELTETFKVNGEIFGNALPKFLPNPTLKQSKEIRSNMVFKNLKVNGTVLIGDEFHNITFKKLLGDVVYKVCNKIFNHLHNIINIMKGL